MALEIENIKNVGKEEDKIQMYKEENSKGYSEKNL